MQVQITLTWYTTHNFHHLLFHILLGQSNINFLEGGEGQDL